MDSNRDPGTFLLFVFAAIVAVMVFVSVITAPPAPYTSTSETCIALVGCNRTP
jgi:hypothetical protein